MLSYQMVENINAWLTVFNKSNALQELADALSLVNTEISSAFNKMLTDAGNAVGTSQNTNNSLNELGNKIATIKGKDIHRQLAFIGEANKDYLRSILGEDNRLIDILDHNINYLSDAYDNWHTSRRSVVTTLNLIHSGLRASECLTSIASVLEGIRNQLFTQIDHVMPEENDIIKIYFGSDGNFDKFAIKVDAIRNIYDHASRLLSISNRQFPLKVLKLESGSWYFLLLGHKKVMSLFTKLLEQTVRFLFRKFTIDGKLSQLSDFREELINQINLKKLLDDEGADTSQMTEVLQASSVIMAKSLVNLLGGEAVVTINNNKMTLGDEMSKKYIEESHKNLIEDLRVEANNGHES